MKRRIVILGVLLFLLCLGVFIFCYLRKDSLKENSSEKKEYSVIESLEVNYGSSLPVISDFVQEEVDGNLEVYYEGELVSDSVLTKVGTYDVRLTIDDVVYSSKIVVQDKEKPVLKLRPLEITVGESYKLSSFVESCEDNSKKDCVLSFEEDKMGKYTENGTYTITIVATDESGNVEKQTTQLTIRKVSSSVTPSSGSTSSSSGSSKTTKEVKTNISYKYGVKITTTETITYQVFSDGTKKEIKRTSKNAYDHSSFNATTKDMLAEAKSQITIEKKNMQSILSETNKYREELGIKPLVLDTTLTQAAHVRAIEMAWGDLVSHTRPNGTSCFTVLDDFSYPLVASGENIAYGQSNGTKAASWWRNSEGHYKNMTNVNYTKIGIGVYKFNGKYYYVQLFSS